MSREPRGVTGRKITADTDPYAKGQPHPIFSKGATASLANTGPSSSSTYTTGQNGPQTVTSARQLDPIPKRVKPLPPDANVSAIPPNTKFYQLENTFVLFSCSTCRKSNIRSDLLAINVDNNQFTCSRCFTKLIRPKNFVPTRLVPFPSLLSWLNYHKPNVLSATQNGAKGGLSARPAEAVVPTGDRLATGLAVNGFSSNDVRALPSSAMVHEISASDTYGQAALHELRLQHPCYRLWGDGKCVHGSLCMFSKAPYKQAIEYLMGIATEQQCLDAGLIVDDVFDLPNKVDPFPSLSTVPPLPPSGASSSDINDPSTVLGAWIARRSKTLNQAEWQLFHNGPLATIVDRYITFPQATTAKSINDKKVFENADDDNVASHESMVEKVMEEEEDDLGALLDGL